ncbi:hypothetical protein Pla52n_14580 [Stieleria varia]|uniref:Uncharacterized protein n=1 Tax=Stieleria varia TaxID=2528005 RepID=A0A5C6B0Q0_9BACT|nr:hypothetical protein Pla52n_14580 [Stieleria varia]
MSVAKAVTIATKGLTFDIVRQSGLFPPIHLLNSFLRCGVDDAGSEIILQWEPFTLNASEYDEFYETCKTLMGNLAVDGLGCDAYAGWFSAATVLHKNG